MHVYPLGGLYDECYNPCLSDLSIRSIETEEDLRRLNGAFWGWLLTPERMHSTIEALRNRWRFVPVQDLPYRWRAVIKAPELFVSRVTAALEELTRYDLSEQELFGAVESVSTVCKLYSEMLFLCELTITEGFVAPALSSKKLVKDCLVPAKNPYLPFLEEYCFPFLKVSRPDALMVHGAPHMSTFAMAYRVKLWFPDTRVILCDHSSEYFSLNKIAGMLPKNRYLYNIIDEVVLDGDDAPANGALRDSLTRGRPSATPATVDYSAVVSGKMYPNRVCPWRKCHFCGINAKYPHGETPDESLDQKIAAIRAAVAEGVRYFWFYDEALPAGLLREFAQAVVDEKLSFVWHVRARLLDEPYSPALCRLLADSGLREIRFGLESANVGVQKMIGKFEHFDLAGVEETIQNFTDAGIGFHMPCIVGFPGETAVQRRETYDFLARMRARFPLFTFNINILELDISSDYYRFPERYGLTGVTLPCKEEFFLGNFADSWSDANGPFDRAALAAEQSAVMRECLYPWMPTATLTPTKIYYRLSENLRLTLRWKQQQAGAPETVTIRAPAPSPWLVRLDEDPAVVYDLGLYKAYGAQAGL